LTTRLSHGSDLLDPLDEEGRVVAEGVPSLRPHERGDGVSQQLVLSRDRDTEQDLRAGAIGKSIGERPALSVEQIGSAVEGESLR